MVQTMFNIAIVMLLLVTISFITLGATAMPLLAYDTMVTTSSNTMVQTMSNIVTVT
ncbi:hypothetical protein [Pediococcus acidilactici]|uniref:hypothetical protein n=1 Tax=Pediococcus acidilactici TaxID=1254 RepID=UPI0013307814|nr:hypothetical protein [Pediococcus acidilactici]